MNNFILGWILTYFCLKVLLLSPAWNGKPYWKYLTVNGHIFRGSNSFLFLIVLLFLFEVKSLRKEFFSPKMSIIENVLSALKFFSFSLLFSL